MSLYTTSVVQNDLDFISNSGLEFEKFRNATILITGINGMLATYLAYSLLFINDKFELNIKILGLGRNKEEFVHRFNNNRHITFIEQDINDEIRVDQSVDYIFHAATNANPENMITHPVSISLVNTLGTKNVAEFARKTGAHVHFFSTREIYGSSNQHKLQESSDSILNPLDVRNVYPISKLAAESMLLAYKNEYDLSISISRIAHAYGPGMKIKNDGRVMADFLGKIINKKNIVLNSAGIDERAFIYVRDAILAIFNIVLKHTSDAFVFNVSNETEPIMVKNLAYMVQQCGMKCGSHIDIKFSTNLSRAGYSKIKRRPLDTNQLENLGWNPTVSLEDGILNTLVAYNELKDSDLL